MREGGLEGFDDIEKLSVTGLDAWKAKEILEKTGDFDIRSSVHQGGGFSVKKKPSEVADESPRVFLPMERNSVKVGLFPDGKSQISDARFPSVELAFQIEDILKQAKDKSHGF